MLKLNEEINGWKVVGSPQRVNGELPDGTRYNGEIYEAVKGKERALISEIGEAVYKYPSQEESGLRALIRARRKETKSDGVKPVQFFKKRARRSI